MCWPLLCLCRPFCIFERSLHRKKRVTSFPSPAGMSLTKLPLGRNNSVMTSLLPPRESLVVTSRLGTGNSQTFFLRCGFEPRVLQAKFVMICDARITAAVTFSAVSSSRTFVGILRSSASRPRHSPTKKA